MGRPRPRIEGRANARTAEQNVESQAPKDARLVPKELSNLDNPRALAARRMLGKTSKRDLHIAQRTGQFSSHFDPCSGQTTVTDND